MKQTKTTILFTPGFTSVAVIKDILGEETKGKGEFFPASNSRVQFITKWKSGQDLKASTTRVERNKSTHSAYLPMLSSLMQFRATPMKWCCPHPSQVLLPISHQGNLSQTCSQANRIYAILH